MAHLSDARNGVPEFLGPNTTKLLSLEVPARGFNKAATSLAEWRVVAAMLLPCEASICQEALVAAWDGYKVVIAAATQFDGQDTWLIRPRFSLRPRPRLHQGVRSLQLGEDGTLLSVLSGDGAVQSWNLQTGEHIGAWGLAGGNVAAMCHVGDHLVLGRNDAMGPVLEVVRLPSALRA